MFRYIFEYVPIWGSFTRLVEFVMANSAEQAKIKFWSSDAGNNCSELITFYEG